MTVRFEDGPFQRFVEGCQQLSSLQVNSCFHVPSGTAGCPSLPLNMEGKWRVGTRASGLRPGGGRHPDQGGGSHTSGRNGHPDL
jgi:hypothetical protein